MVALPGWLGLRGAPPSPYSDEESETAKSCPATRPSPGRGGGAGDAEKCCASKTEVSPGAKAGFVHSMLEGVCVWGGRGSG